MRPLAGAIATLVTCAAPALAQTITGRVLMPDSVTPAAGIVVAITTPNGNNIGRALTTRTGAYSVRLRAPGQYDVRALRVGYRPTVVRVVVAAGATVTQNIVLASLPVSIVGITATGDGDCKLRGRDAQLFLTLWEQTRTALAAASLWEQSGALEVDMVRMSGRIDHGPSWSVYPDSVYPVQDTGRVQQLALTRAFAATPPETLETKGYVRPSRDGTPIFDMPNPEALLSDGFIANHCFSLERNDDRRDWIGLGFEPRRRVNRVVSISGVLWLDSASSELRRIEFKYANLPDARYHICDSIAVIPVRGELILDDPPFTQPKPGCYSQRNSRSNELGLGGSADLVRLPTGEWLISKWSLIMPPDSARYRANAKRCRPNRQTQECEACWYGPNCFRLKVMRPRMATLQGVTTRVARDGIEIYRDTSADALVEAMIRKRAKDDPAHLVGVVVDENRRPVAGAIVQTEDPWRSARTDGDGVFRVQTLPAGALVVSVRCDGYVAKRFRVPLVRDSTHRVRVDLAPDTVGVRGAGCTQR